MNLEATRLQKFEHALRKEKINSCLISHNNEVVFKYYKNRKMETKLFQVHSCTKSIVSILIGIAIDQGLIESVQVPIETYFPYIGADKKQITIEHLLTMTPGWEWGEFSTWQGLPFPMINTKHWEKFILEQKMVSQSGQHMVYDSGSSHLLSIILKKETNGNTAAFAEKMLFKPLGITDYRWYKDSKGVTIGGFGLCLQTADMLRIGQMLMDGGLWRNKQVVSRSWIENSTTAKFHTYNSIGSYGYHFWVLANEEKQPYDPNVFFAMGYGGQYIIVSPEDRLVVVYTSELFNDTFFPLRLFRNHIFS
ncbi:serine hydrolase domain-containing protein [Paenibacillus albiflavus]|uniref:serine hydrolase domain-containing protein n=1 Tax=Paenibacillus albiflavus TaxID=2545760 RepID=UPI0014052BFB|nr:serine hydrolase [Paenibacillus albiflavus]